MSRKKFTKEQKDQAVKDYISGVKTANELANELDTEAQSIYRWKAAHTEKQKGIRLNEIIDEGHTREQAKKIQQLEQQNELFKAKLAEQSIIIDLLKKLQTPSNFQPESELNGLIETTKKSAQKRKQQK